MKQINDEYVAIIAEERGGNHRIVDRAIKVGTSPLHCKTKVGHGGWVSWVGVNLPQISKRTVERWMKLAENKTKIEEEIKARITRPGLRGGIGPTAGARLDQAAAAKASRPTHPAGAACPSHRRR